MNQTFSALLWQFDKLFLGRLISGDGLGRFYMAGNITTLPFQVFAGPIVRPFAAALSLRDARSSLAGAFQKSTRGLCFVMAPLIVSLAVLSHPMVILVLGKKWENIAQWVCLLALASLPALLIQMLTPLCVMLNRAGALAIRSGAEFALYAPMVALGFFAFGIDGVIWARFLSLFVSAAVGLLLVRSLLGLGIREQLANLVVPAAATATLALVLICLTFVYPEPVSRFQLAMYIGALGAIGIATYLATTMTVWWFRGRPEGVERVLATLLGRFARHVWRLSLRRG